MKTLKKFWFEALMLAIALALSLTRVPEIAAMPACALFSFRLYSKTLWVACALAGAVSASSMAAACWIEYSNPALWTTNGHHAHMTVLFGSFVIAFGLFFGLFVRRELDQIKQLANEQPALE